MPPGSILILLILLPLVVPLFQPVSLSLGGWVVMAGRQPANSLPALIHSEVVGGHAYDVRGVVQERRLPLGDWEYSLCWFKGRQVR